MTEEMLVQAWLRSGKTMDALEAKYAITAKRGVKHPNLVSLRYDQIASPFAEPIVRECRGLVLDEADGWRCVCRSMDKFMNHGDPLAAEIDWSTARCLEKVDGTLCQLFFYAGAWHCATTGTPDASGEVNGNGLSFSELFFRTFDESGMELPPQDLGVTMFFELTTPLNRVVVRHETASLTLLGGRDLRTMQELTAEDVASLYLPGARVVRSFPLQGWADIMATFSDMNPLAQEGYVIVDHLFRRQKCKHPGYVAWHSVRSSSSPRAFVKVALAGEESEFLSAFPEYQPQFYDYRARIEAWTKAVDADYASMPVTAVQKTFAQAAVLTRCSSAMFQIRAGKSRNARAFLAATHLDRAMEYLGVKTSGG